MIVTTSDTIAGHRIVTTHGLARGNTLRARHIGRDIMAALRGLIGGEITDYTKMLAEAREQSLDRMNERSQSGFQGVPVCPRRALLPGCGISVHRGQRLARPVQWFDR